MGVGAELAISTDKLHHRGPLGLNQLVTNKYYVYGEWSSQGVIAIATQVSKHRYLITADHPGPQTTDLLALS
jgi:hypothetical protein